jgi:tyrosinase
MAVVRTNVMTDRAARAAYVQGVLALTAEMPRGATSTALGLEGPAQPLSTWDLFVLWHGRAAAVELATGRGTIHQGPVFCVWHRWMLLLLEANMARILGQPDFALPYWDWGADGARPASQQPGRPVFRADAFGGGTGGPPTQPGGPRRRAPVPDGPFGSPSGFVVRVADGPNGPRSVNRPLQRRLGALTRLPSRTEVTALLGRTPYDTAPFDATLRTDAMRNRLEGWIPRTVQQPPPHGHNRVHVFVGGDMEMGTSPNDPLFYVNHANVDRIWAAWQQRHAALPASQRYPSASTVPAGHRLADPLYSALTQRLGGPPVVPAVRDMLNVANLYSYDVLPT